MFSLLLYTAILTIAPYSRNVADAMENEEGLPRPVLALRPQQVAVRTGYLTPHG